jgi:4-amino-4-deoxy-L-arabinose transferase-like glycosyltransferase
MPTLSLPALPRLPAAAWVCALVAFLNAACWSFITPPFQVPDEQDHFAYVQQLAETGHLPSQSVGQSSSALVYSPEETVALADLRYRQVRREPANHPISSIAQQRKLERDLALPLPRRGSGYAGVASTEPPLYYALEMIPYALGSVGTILDRLQLMRLLSAIMAGLTALFVFLFLREALPGVPWAWTVGGLGVAVDPTLGFISGGVNPDAMLFVVSAALFWCLARGFRHGLTRRLALATSAVIAIGLLTKLNFIGLVPGAVLALILLARRAARTEGTGAYRSLALALAIGASPAFLYALINLLSGHPALGFASGVIDFLSPSHDSLLSELGYIWQFYLPRLPGMRSWFPGIFTTRQVWFDGLVGLYGWLDTPFPAWVYDIALIPVGLIALLCVRALADARAALRKRLAELVIYAVIGGGVLAIVGASSYVAQQQSHGPYNEPRYLLPMLALFGAVLALAARGAGRRWGPATGTLIVVLLIAQDVFSQLQTIARYYG